MDASAPLQQLTVLIVDCQTTGASPDKGELLDLAWTFTSAEARDSSSIDGGLLQLDGELPRRIARMTGVAEDDFDQAVPRDEMRDRFLAAVSQHDGPVVAHYARFEQRFLDDFLTDRDWETSLFCTHAIARRLLPELPRLGIRALSGFFGTSMDEEKRAAGHVAASARIWSQLAELLAEEGVTTLGELEQWLATTAKPSRSSRIRRFPLPREQRLALPEIPGVYRMLARDGVVLYVGKATSLKSRVNSYYRGKKGEGERKLELVTQVWDLDVTPTDTPLHAAILEQREIKTHEPPYNRQFRTNDRTLAWVDPKDLSSRSVVPTERHTLGPLPSMQSLDGATWLIQAAGGSVGPLAFADVAEDVLAAGVELFAAEAEDLGMGPSAWSDPLVLAELGEHYRGLDDDEADGDEVVGDEEDDTSEEAGAESQSADDWTPENVADYARWVTRGVARTVRRARSFQMFRNGDLEWASPATGERCVIAWRSGRVLGEPGRAAEFGEGFDLHSYDETAVLIGELKRLIRYRAALLLDTGSETFDTDELAEFFGR